ncbi:hypothetical protein [Moraxella porci]|uniref:hypothetical protein n=1 Tax=Moraxella porci TaxID=1288392 RepID=UPI00244A5E5A|nr:hypothetical protein [Moraxella porci]MDH2274246.1 hypothetical protein [Moraxella porci]
MSNFNGVIKRSIMRELSADVADAMRTSSQIEVETENYDLDFSDVINQTPVEEAEAVVELAPESDDADDYMEDPDSLWGRIERQMGTEKYQVWLAEHLARRREQPRFIIKNLSGFDENNQPILETFCFSESAEDTAPAEQTERSAAPAQTADQAPEFGHSNSNHLEEPPQRENSEADQPKVKQINIHIDLDLYKLLVPAAAITGLAIVALGYRKQDKLIGGLKAIKTQIESLKKD